MPCRSSSTKKRGRSSQHTSTTSSPDGFDMQNFLDVEDFQFPSIEFPAEETSDSSRTTTTTEDLRPSKPESRPSGEKRRRLLRRSSKGFTNLAALVAQATPTLSESQQEFSEYALPIVLPTLFVSLSMTTMALHCVAVLVAGHTIETFYTNFRAHADAPSSSRQLLSPQHFQCTCLYPSRPIIITYILLLLVLLLQGTHQHGKSK